MSDFKVETGRVARACGSGLRDFLVLHEVITKFGANARKAGINCVVMIAMVDNNGGTITVQNIVVDDVTFENSDNLTIDGRFVTPALMACLQLCCRIEGQPEILNEVAGHR